jgi:hypothetical protein
LGAFLISSLKAKKMPVFATLTGVPSNKQEEGGKGKKVGKIPRKKICYIPIEGQVAVLKPIIDKISITYIGDPDLKASLRPDSRWTSSGSPPDVVKMPHVWVSSTFRTGG